MRWASRNGDIMIATAIGSATNVGHVDSNSMILSETIFEGHHQGMRVWVICLYFMGLNLSNSWKRGAIGTNRSIIAWASMPEMRMAMASVKCISTPWKVTAKILYNTSDVKSKRWISKGMPSRLKVRT